MKYDASVNNISRNHSVPQRKRNVSLAKTDWLMLFEEVIAVYSNNHPKSVNTLHVYKAEMDYYSKWYI
jgi:hypothetical protein